LTHLVHRHLSLILIFVTLLFISHVRIYDLQASSDAVIYSLAVSP
jgi:hypothetical protein